MAKMTVSVDDSGDIHFSGIVTKADLHDIRLDDFDGMVIRDCSGPKTLAHDWLLGLEILFRRLHEQKTPKEAAP